MLDRIKKAIDLMHQTKGEVYLIGDNLEKIINQEGMIFGLSKNGEKKVFFEAEKAKTWKINTGGTLCNVYQMLARTSDNEVLQLVSKSKELTADLKTWMRIKNVKQVELSEVLNVSVQTVKNWISHKSVPNVVLAFQLAKELDVDIKQIEW